ncbi:MAG: hypothetical protein IJH34_12640, partial [Romboutsia sp.]|nr:hypothetical protein [Romboutsia sp.]
MKKQFAVRTNDLEFAYDEGREFNYFKIAKIEEEMGKLREWNFTSYDSIDNQILGVYFTEDKDS